MFELQDYPIQCCGMVLAAGISTDNFLDSLRSEGVLRESPPSKSELIDKIEEHQRKHRRNVAMLTLSDAQKYVGWGDALEARGWNMIQKVYNPNSGSHFYIYTHILWEDADQYRAALDGGYVVPIRADVNNRHHWPEDIDFNS